jgi:hypothetical protein
MSCGAFNHGNFFQLRKVASSETLHDLCTGLSPLIDRPGLEKFPDRIFPARASQDVMRIAEKYAGR